MSRWITTIILCVCCTKLSTQEVRIVQVGVKLDDKTLKEISDALYFQMRFYAKVFGDEKVQSFKARVFGNERDYQQYSKREMAYNPLRRNAIAYYSPRQNEMVMHTNIRGFVTVFKHELSHAIFNSYCRRYPSWLTEGLSELMEGIELEGNTFKFNGVYLQHYRDAVSFMAAKPKLKDMLYVSSINNHDASRNYTMAWAIMAYLYATNKGVLRDIIRAGCGNREDILDIAYPGGLPILEADMRGYFFNEFPPAR